MTDTPAPNDMPEFKKGDYVRKKGDKGQWHGRVCGFYSTECTPRGVAVESVYEKNSVQIYPANALELWDFADSTAPVAAGGEDRYDEGFDDGHAQGYDEGKYEATEFDRDLRRIS